MSKLGWLLQIKCFIPGKTKRISTKSKAYGFYLELYTDKNKLVEWLSSGKRTDLLVISASLYNEL